jgi:hypothetical protein
MRTLDAGNAVAVKATGPGVDGQTARKSARRPAGRSAASASIDTTGAQQIGRG